MHQPTSRVLEILELMAGSNGQLRLTDFSRDLAIPKSTLLPILQTLCSKRYLYQDDRGYYGAGTELFSLGAAFSGCFPLLEHVKRELAGLVQDFHETCYCGTLEQGDVLYLCKQDSTQPLRVLTDTGKRMPAYATSLGKSLLLDHTPEQLQQLYPNGLQAITAHTVTEFQTLRTQLNQARKNGYTWESQESTPHVCCFAAPIRKHGRIVAAISMAIPVFRYEESQKESITTALRDTAARLSRLIEQTDAHFGELF